MDLVSGIVTSLISKLTELLKEEYNMQISAKQDVQYLQRELRSMHAALGAMAEVPRNQLAEQDRLWAGDVRELSQDMEDLVESFLVCVAASVPPADEVSAPPADADSVPPVDAAGCFTALKAKMATLFKMAKARHEIGMVNALVENATAKARHEVAMAVARREIATAVKDIKVQVTEVANRDDRYRGHGGFIAASAPATARITTIDPYLSVMYGNQKIVGMNDTTDNIIEKLRDGDDVSNQHLKILSIVGFGGMGKTTLAKSVYDKLQGGFDCRAFVPVSRNPNLKKVLKDLLFELDKQKYNSLNLIELSERQLIAQLRESLRTKRYFIIIDDIWDTVAWETIRFAFVDSNSGSRIITTTRNIDVSKACCSLGDHLIHDMRPLSEGESEKLFYERIFGSETRCPPQLKQVSRDILKKCAGVPLAILTLASHLASNQQIKPEDQWYDLLKSIGRGLTNGGSVEEMRKILSLSYYDLPSYLKTCLLYLSVFPEDYLIDRGRLIRRWIAEGFIQGDNLFELGDSYFNELVNRSLIQPVDISHDGRAEACRVHDMMLDLICDLSSEQNFVSVLFDLEVKPFERKVRRLSLHRGMTKLTETQLATTSMSQVRSFTLFSPASMIALSRFKVLRVLDLDGCNMSSQDLRCVGNLLHLRYLGLGGRALHREIPEEIGKLLFLQILDLGGVRAREVPASFVGLRSLICLFLGWNSYLPFGFRNLTCLQELTEACFTQDAGLEELGYLTKLRVLSFSWKRDWPVNKQVILVESLGKLHKLESLHIRTDDGVSIDLLRDWMPSRYLRRLELGLCGWFVALPRWISSSSLPRLSFLEINVYRVRLEDVQILGTLPALQHLKLSSVVDDTATMESSLMLSSDAFPCARECLFAGVILAPWMLAPGAMPLVRSLEFSLRLSDILSGDQVDVSTIRNIPSLEQLKVDLYDKEPRSETHEEAKAALMRIGDDHLNRPVINIQSCSTDARSYEYLRHVLLIRAESPTLTYPGARCHGLGPSGESDPDADIEIAAEKVVIPAEASTSSTPQKKKRKTVASKD